MKLKPTLLLISSLAVNLAFPSQSFAADCFSTLTGNQSVSGNCTLVTYEDGDDPSRLVSGVDSGTGNTNSAVLTVSSGTMTINGNETLVFGELSLTGGSVALASGASMEVGKSIYMIDTDNDGSPSEVKFYVGSTPPNNGRRLNEMTFISSVDCDDSSGAISAGDTTTFFQDSDGDSFGNPSVSQAACDQPVGYVVNNTDCYDSNANAKPGSSTCSGTHRGDGSFDYDCNGVSNRCSTLLGTSGSCSASTCLSYCQGGTTCTCNYPTICTISGTASCGSTGYVCASTANYANSCAPVDDHTCSHNTSSYCTSTSTQTQNCQ